MESSLNPRRKSNRLVGVGQTEFTLVDMRGKLPKGVIITVVAETRSQKAVHIRYECSESLYIEIPYYQPVVGLVIY